MCPFLGSRAHRAVCVLFSLGTDPSDKQWFPGPIPKKGSHGGKIKAYIEEEFPAIAFPPCFRHSGHHNKASGSEDH